MKQKSINTSICKSKYNNNSKNENNWLIDTLLSDENKEETV